MGKKRMSDPIMTGDSSHPAAVEDSTGRVQVLSENTPAPEPTTQTPPLPEHGNGKSRQSKGPRMVAYLVVGQSRHDASVQVLHITTTKGKARRWWDSVRMFLGVNYHSVVIYQCRDKTQEVTDGESGS